MPPRPQQRLAAIVLTALTLAIPSHAAITLTPKLRIAIPGVETLAYHRESGAILASAAGGVVRITAEGDHRTIFDPQALPATTPLGPGSEVTHVTTHPTDPHRAFAAVLPPDPCRSVGFVAEFHPITGETTALYPVGFHPDCVAIDPTTGAMIVANEGEPRWCESPTARTLFDPHGSITVITPPFSDPANTRTIHFTHTLAESPDLRTHPETRHSPAMDIEPEYIAIEGDTAYISLQENNAIATLHIPTRTLAVHPMPVLQQRLDADKSDGPAIIHTSPTLPMPDMLAVATPSPSEQLPWSAAGITRILVTANEGDTRGSADDDDATRPDETTVGTLLSEHQLGRPASAKVSSYATPRGEHAMFGSRSISVFDATTMTHLAHSEDALERWFLSNHPRAFNANDDDPTDPDNRSDDRGPEPEGITAATINGTTYAFVTLERPGAIAVFNLSNPFDPVLEHVHPAFTLADTAPEGVIILPPEAPGAPHRLAVAFEGSGSLVVYTIETQDVNGLSKQ